jgi:hypothetical protein
MRTCRRGSSTRSWYDTGSQTGMAGATTHITRLLTELVDALGSSRLEDPSATRTESGYGKLVSAWQFCLCSSGLKISLTHRF